MNSALLTKRQLEDLENRLRLLMDAIDLGKYGLKNPDDLVGRGATGAISALLQDIDPDHKVDQAAEAWMKVGNAELEVARFLKSDKRTKYAKARKEAEGLRTDAPSEADRLLANIDKAQKANARARRSAKKADESAKKSAPPSESNPDAPQLAKAMTPFGPADPVRPDSSSDDTVPARITPDIQPAPAPNPQSLINDALDLAGQTGGSNPAAVTQANLQIAKKTVPHKEIAG